MDLPGVVTSRHQHGFALLSLLLALALGGALLYGYYEFVHRQRHLDDAKTLALRLVQYNAAVAQRILDEAHTFTPATWTGVAWLQNATNCTGGHYTPPTTHPDRTYLPCDFPERWPYSLGPHSVGTNTGTAQEVTTSLVEFGTTTPALPVVRGQTHAVAAARVVAHAKTILSANVIHQDVFLQPVGTLPPTHIEAIASTIGAAPELYLRVDGTNHMEADFDGGGFDLTNIQDAITNTDQQLGMVAFMGNLQVGQSVDKWTCPTGLAPSIQVAGVPQNVPGTVTSPLIAWQFQFSESATAFTLQGQMLTASGASGPSELRVAVIGQCT